MLTEPDKGNLIDDLTDIVQSFAEIIKVSPFASVMAILAGECAHDPELSAMLTPHISLRRDPLLNALKRAIARNELPPDIDLEAATDLIMGPIITRAFFTHTEIDPTKIRPLVEAALYGINRLRI